VQRSGRGEGSERGRARLGAGGRRGVHVTTGSCGGIGGKGADGIEGVGASAESHGRHGHVQEVIVQNFWPKAGTGMHSAPPCGRDACLDAIALEAMERLDPAHLLATVAEHNISMCGVLPAVIVMETLRRLGGLPKAERVSYATSAEVSGDMSRVVGYAGMLIN